MADTVALLKTALTQRYAIEREIGAGGMAVVYAAEDIRHRRKVAIKVLRPDISAALGAERFLREIETAASLRHPHIVPLFDSGDAAGTLFYVMPLVEGESLRARLNREERLPIEDALQITREVADALSYAHRRGVIHRDIKPENVLLEAGHAVVTDFGIARVVDDARSETLTQPGTALGTPRYMSPEQFSGEHDIDGRADLYSLACMLFEMLAGRPPFTGPSLSRTVYQHLSETPPPIANFRRSVPVSVASALQRALSKDPADRFATMTAFAEALLGSPSENEPRSVAVLPFLNFSNDPENEYFADGITEDVITQLSKVRALKVVSRTSVMPFKRRDVELREIGERLRVSALLDGSVRRAGNRVRIAAQLVDVATDQHLWSETYDRDLTDIFAIQSEVALQITTALKAELSSDESVRIGRKPTANVHAYQHYLQGRHFLIRFTERGIRSAIEHFERAIELDDRYAPPYAGLAQAFTEMGEMGMLDPDEAYPRAGASAAIAITLDPELDAAHCTMAYCKMVHEFDWAAAEAGFKRAIELSPSYADAYDLYGRLCAALERHDEAIELTQRAQELDPLSHRVDVATSFLRAGRYPEAVDSARRAVELDQGDSRAHATLGWALLLVGRNEQGLAELTRAAELTPDGTGWLAQLGQAYCYAGQPERGREVLDRLLEWKKTRYVAPYHLAYVYTGLLQYDDAVDCLEQAFEQRAGAMYGVKGSFLFRPLHSHPRFQELMERMQLD